MFNRVNAFLEAIDKKSEEMADAAAEEDIVQSLQLRQPLEHDAHTHLHHSNTSSINHNITGAGVRPSSSTAPSSFHAVEGWAGDQKNVSHNSTAAGSAAASTTGTSSALAFATSAALRASAEPPSHAGRSDHSYATHAAGPRVAPLALPTKLPSFRSSLSDTDAVARGGLRRASEQGKGGVDASGLRAADTLSKTHDSAFLLSPAPASSTARGDVLSDANGSSAAAAADTLERLQARCTKLEAESTKWQQEAATHRAQGGAAREALWKAEQDARASRAAQRDAEQALAAYKETAQRLLEEAQQEVRRAQAASRSGINSANEGDAASQQQQRQQLAEEARDVRQRFELLQAEHTALLSDVDRYQHEAAKATTELQQLQATCRRAEDRVDALQLDVHATRESLAGEVAAHADTKAALRQLLTQQQQRAPQQTTEVTTSSSETAGSEDVAQLQREVREARQRHQLLLLQASNRQTALDAAEREVADLKARYNDLVRQFDDAQVEVDAGFRGAGYASATPGFGVSGGGSSGGGNGQRPRGAGAVGGADHAGGGAAGLLSDKPSSAAPPLLLSATPDALRRNPVMVQLARRYGAVGRASVSGLAALDAAALRLGRVLIQSRWVWRVMLVGYVLLLQLWVVLMVLASLASDN